MQGGTENMGLLTFKAGFKGHHSEVQLSTMIAHSRFLKLCFNPPSGNFLKETLIFFSFVLYSVFVSALFCHFVSLFWVSDISDIVRPRVKVPRVFNQTDYLFHQLQGYDIKHPMHHLQTNHSQPL